MSILHHIGDFFRQLLLKIPLGVARGLFVLLLISLLVWVLTRPRTEMVNPANPASGPAENLKLWAALALGIQIVIYLLV